MANHNWVEETYLDIMTYLEIAGLQHSKFCLTVALSALKEETGTTATQSKSESTASIIDLWPLRGIIDEKLGLRNPCIHSEGAHETPQKLAMFSVLHNKW